MALFEVGKSVLMLETFWTAVQSGLYLEILVDKCIKSVDQCFKASHIVTHASSFKIKNKKKKMV